MLLHFKMHVNILKIDKQHHEFEFWKVLTMIPTEMKRPVFELGKGCLHISGEDYGKACLEFITCLKKGNPEVNLTPQKSIFFLNSVFN